MKQSDNTLPSPDERQHLINRRWESFPEALQTGNQIAGKATVACGATHHVMEKCNFACTCCYLGPEANQTEPLPLKEVQKQLDTLRRELGMGGKTQITAGEVTLLPLEDLGKIIRYALEIGLDPMVMSHGQRFIEEPEYLIALVREYGLRKISIHIDTTQRGRAGTNSTMSETDLHAVRDKFADLIHHVRATTRCPLQVASTVTVTDNNLKEVANITEWFLKNTDAFRILSFLPVADVGRTRSRINGIEREGLWDQIHLGCRKNINPHSLQFGHRKCNELVPLLIAKTGNQHLIFEGVRIHNHRDQKMLERALNVLGSTIQWDARWHRNARNLFSALIQHPQFLLQTAKYTIYRLVSERHQLFELLKRSWKQQTLPKFNPFLFVVHNFMSPDELQTTEGKERLDACIFKVPVDGNLVSMCEMNATDLRAKLDRMQLHQKKPKQLHSPRQI